MRIRAAMAVGLLVVGANQVAAQVSVREEPVTIPTWEIGPPQVHPQFTAPIGSIYPYALNDVLTDRKVDKTYKGVILENEYIKVLVLPEIGGRIHGAIDKTNNYEWLYWQKTIKPGLISLTGAWISGGIEWNFPRGHRPSGFMPVEHRIVRHGDGSATVWVGETEPVYRMRWLVGMTIYPGKSYLRCDYLFINPTSYTQSFQYWSTSATYANEFAQAQYPGDMVTGHGKHQFWNWPVNDGVDLTWWKNSPNAASYFAVDNPSDWFGTYDHRAHGGMVHVADHHTMPGKKLWTWGSGPSGRIWEDILADGGGAYFEPQAGAWSDNQPDFHWLWPNEVKTAHDYWYPVRDTRGYHNASRDFAVNTDVKDGLAFGAVYATSIARDVKVVLDNTRTHSVLREAVVTVSPDKPFTAEVTVPKDVTVFDLHLAVYDAGGTMLIDVQQRPPAKVDLPAGLKDPGDPKAMTADELVLSGDWLDKFLRRGEALTYYREALTRDPNDTHANIAMGFLALKQGEWQEAVDHLNKALERDGDNSRLYFGRALAYAGLRDFDAAYKNFYRATYTYDFAAAAYLELARIDIRRGQFEAALDKLADAEARNGRFADLPALEAAALRHLGRASDALAAADRALDRDPMHFMGGFERAMALRNTATDGVEWSEEWRSIMRGSPQNYLELATAYAGAGLYDDADVVLADASGSFDDQSAPPTLNYLRGYFKSLAGQSADARTYFDKAARGPVNYTNPHRLEERAAIEEAIRQNPRDAHAMLFLGNLLYSKGRRAEGLEEWRKAVALDSALALAWRNIGYGERDLNLNFAASLDAYRRAADLDPGDARALLEFDQVAELKGVPSAERLTYLEAHATTVQARDDLTARYVDLLLESGAEQALMKSLTILRTRHFHSWEGSYGIHEAWVEANRRLAELARGRHDPAAALRYLNAALEYPANLEVAPRTPDFRAHLYWDLARLNTEMKKRAEADKYLKGILAERYGKAHLGTLYQARAQKATGNEQAYQSLMTDLEKTARGYLTGSYENRGDPEVLGHYLLSTVLEERGDKAGAQHERQAALTLNPRAERLAVLDAQLDTASAHQ
jgi:tetratricopeptide (TPR) repeat protein